MNYQEKLKKAIANIERLNYELTGFGVAGKLLVRKPDGNQMLPLPTLEFFSNFAWCPYCNEALGDQPFCSTCGDVSGSDKKFYEFGVTKKLYQYKVISKQHDTCRLLTLPEMRTFLNSVGISCYWDGSLKQLQTILGTRSNMDLEVYEINKWED